MISFDIYFQALGIMLIVAIIFWLISIAIKDVSIVDSLWSLFFLTPAFTPIHNSTRLHFEHRSF